MPFFPRRAAFATVLAFAAPLAVFAQSPAPAGEDVSLNRLGVASVGGTWCGAGLLNGFSLEIAQQLQNVQARLIRKGRVRELTGHVEGTTVKVDPQREHSMELRAEGDELRIIGATGTLALAVGQSFTRAAGGSCAR
jgi:hypothetical protein